MTDDDDDDDDDNNNNNNDEESQPSVCAIGVFGKQITFDVTPNSSSK